MGKQLPPGLMKDLGNRSTARPKARVIQVIAFGNVGERERAVARHGCTLARRLGRAQRCRSPGGSQSGLCSIPASINVSLRLGDLADNVRIKHSGPLHDAGAPPKFDAHFERMWDAAQPMDEFEPGHFGRSRARRARSKR